MGEEILRIIGMHVAKANSLLTKLIDKSIVNIVLSDLYQELEEKRTSSGEGEA